MSEDEGKMVASGGWCSPSESTYPFDLLSTSADPCSWPPGLSPVDPEEYKRRKAERLAKAETKLREHQEWHLSVIEKVSSVPDDSAREALLALLRRHAPRNSYGVIECSGVHDTGCEMEPGEWPCKDFLIIAEMGNND